MKIKSPFRSLEQIIAQRRDAQLIESTLKGDEKSFTKLISLYKKRVFALGMSFFKNEADTEDFMQDVFVKVYQNLARFKGESAFSTWLTRIAYNAAVNAMSRKKDVFPLMDETLLSDPDFTPEEQEIRKATVTAVRAAVAALPEKYGICLELYFFYDMSYEEIVVVTGFPLNTIKSHIFRAKKMLRDTLRGFYDN